MHQRSPHGPTPPSIMRSSKRTLGKWLFGTLLLLLINGCDQHTPDAMLDDYLNRLANSLNREAAPSSADTQLHIPRLPTRKQRRLEIQELRTGLLDSLELRHCGLLPLIAERNSSLGKVMRPSKLLDYELRFFAQLQPCYLRDLQAPILDEKFSSLLTQIYRSKRSGLKAVYWNAVFGSEAMERNLSLSRAALELNQNSGYSDSLRALQQLAALAPLAITPPKPFGLPENLTQLETAYAQLHHSEYGSRLLTSLALITDTLNRATLTINAAENQRPLCPLGRSTTQAGYVHNVFQRYYGAKVQPYLARTHRQGKPWLEQLAQLAATATPTPEWQSYRDLLLATESDIAVWGQFELAIRRHTHSWQQLLGSCGLMPGMERREEEDIKKDS